MGIQKYRYHVTPASNSAHWAKIWPEARSSANSISDLQTLQIFCQKLFSFCVHRIMEVWVSEWSLIKLNITETVRIIRTYFCSDQNINIVHCPHTDWSWIWGSNSENNYWLSDEMVAKGRIISMFYIIHGRSAESCLMPLTINILKLLKYLVHEDSC